MSRKKEKEEIVKFIVNEIPDSVSEVRIHRLIYLMEIYSMCKKGKRKTDLEFCPFMYGMYSEELSDIVEDIDFNTKKGLDVRMVDKYRESRIVDKYRESFKSCEIDSETENTLLRILNMTSNFSNKDLGNWSKETYLYKETEYGTVADWSNLNKSICEKDIEKLDNYQ